MPPRSCSWALAAVAMMLVMCPGERLLGAELRSGFAIGKEFEIQSQVLKEMRTYWVSLPDAYDASAQRRYSVLYLLDAETHFNLVASIVDFMSAGTYGNNNQIPELIVVGVVNTDRLRDLTPTASKKGFDGKVTSRYDNSGGGDAFLDFMERELIPRIESTYRTDSHRTLAGHSLAGLLSAHAFMTRPKLFKAHILIDPSSWWDDDLLLRRLRESKRLATDVETIYLSLAYPRDIGAEAPKKTLRRGQALGTLLRSAYAPPTRTKVEYFEDEDHVAVPLRSVYEGLRFVFDGFTPATDEATPAP
jgi:predicted alpha/beta superfamily hydrolase